MIKFFISSTFLDMKDERDALHTRVYPILREYGLERGVSVDICDLRWGIYIDETWSEEKATREIMNVCFGELKSCQPYIISMIGDYYGSVPEKQGMIQELWKNYKKQEVAVKDKISLTHWELEFSFLSEVYPNVNAICMFKHNESNEDVDEKALKLKQKIKDKAKKNSEHIICYQYNGIDEFCDYIIKKIKEFIDYKSEERKDNWVEVENNYSSVYCGEKIVNFAGREEFLSLIEKNIYGSDKRMIEIYGKSGIGKSSSMANLYNSALSKGKKALILFIGLSDRTREYLQVLLYFNYMLEKEIKENNIYPRDDVYVEEKAEELLIKNIKLYESSIKTKEYVFFIDNVGKLGIKAEKLIDLFYHVGSKKLKIVYSRIEAKENNKRNHFTSIELKELTEEEKNSIIKINFFNSIQSIEGNKIIDSVIEKSGSSSPLYLSFLISIVKMHLSDIGGQYYKIIELIQNLPKELEELCWKTIKEATFYLKSNMRIDTENLFEIIGFIASSRYGLLEKDIEKLVGDFNWRTVDFVYLRSFLKDFFRQQDSGNWVFEHDIINKGIQDYYQYNKKDISTFRKELYKYIKEEGDIEIQVKEGIYLSNLFGDYEMAITIFRNVVEANMMVRRMAANELLNIINFPYKKGYNWFSYLILNYLEDMIKLLLSLMEYENDDDYLRRLPAKKIMDIFWEIFEKKKNIQMNDDWNFANLHIEYLNVCECVGEEETAFQRIQFPVQFFQINAARFTEEEKILAYRSLNTILYINNKIMSSSLKKSHNMSKYTVSREISESIINSFYEDIFGFHRSEMITDTRSRVRGIYERYISNIGQFYNGIGAYNKALRYHYKSLMLKIESFLDLLDNQTKEFQDFVSKSFSFDAVCIDECDLLKIDFLAQYNFWKSAQITFKSTTNLSFLQLKWKVIGVGYRTIASDCFYMEETQDRVHEFREIGDKCIEIAYQILTDERFQVPDREKYITFLLRIGILTKKENLLEEDLNLLLEWTVKAIKMYFLNKENYGKVLKIRLIDYVGDVRRCFHKLKKEEKIGVIDEMLEQLEREG